MISLIRPAIPVQLAATAGKELNQLWSDWRQNKPLRIKNAVYASSEVKTALKSAQHEKCAYCETKNPRSHDVVEHFRPKRGWRQNRQMALQTPGYFWLAYEWSNLLFACDMCNDAGHKQNLFPLIEPKNRATPALPDTSSECPLLIDPYQEDPAHHIEWSNDTPRAKNGSPKGLLTIRVFKLSQDQSLIDARRGHFNVIKVALEAAEGFPANDPRRVNVKVVLQEAASDRGAYSAMVRAAFGDRINAL